MPAGKIAVLDLRTRRLQPSINLTPGVDGMAWAALVFKIGDHGQLTRFHRFIRRDTVMTIDQLRQLCLSFPGATEKVTWGNDLTFRVDEKIFAVTVLEPAPVWLSFKCSPENFAELTERAGIIPAPYLARAKWIALETKDALPDQELAQLLRQSYDLVFAKLPRKTRESVMQQGKPARKPGARSKHGESKVSNRKTKQRRKKS